MERIMLSRKKAGITQQQLADSIGVQRAVISKYENGTIEPSITQICKIADVLGVSVSYLLGRTEDHIDVLSCERAKIFCARLQHSIDQADPSDLQELYGTSQPYQDILDGSVQISLTVANEIASNIGVPLIYLIGLTDDPEDASAMQAKDILAFESFQQKIKMELLQSKEQIISQAPTAIRNAQAALIEKVDEICKDPSVLDESLQLQELQLMPSRIGLVIDFLDANKGFLQKNMPGMIPHDE